MKALRTKISTYAIALLISCGFTAPLMAGSSDFSGIYGAFTGSAGGAQLSGRHVDNDGQITSGKVGGVFPVAGYEIGFNLPLGDVFFIGAGHSWSQSGTAKIASGKDETAKSSTTQNSNFHLKAKNLKEIYTEYG